jgi:SH3-like domain-containing protein
MRVSKSLKLSALVLGILSSIATPLVFAKNINLYTEPKTDSKVIASIDSTSTMVPIFSNKAGDWMKVGDPKNGNVGWVKLSDFTNSKADANAEGFSMTSQTVNTANGPQTYRTIKFGANEAAADNAKTQAVIQKFQDQQAQLLKNTQQIYNNMYRDLNALYQANPNAFVPSGLPVFMPIIVIPAQAATPPATPPKPVAAPVAPLPPPAPPKP